MLLFALVAVVGCGSSVVGIGTMGDGGPGPGNQGDDTIGPVEDGGSPFDPRCASGDPIGTGFACGVSGLTCPLGTIADCNGGRRTLQCFCDGVAWSCDPVTSPDCEPVATCPDPSTLYPGSPCNVPPGQQCVSTDIPANSCGGKLLPATVKGICTCTAGGWSCPPDPATCPAGGPTCPDPYSVYVGNACPGPGLICPGNPSTCGNQIFYDALECTVYTWVSLAATACDIDGGSEDAPYFWDASPAESGLIYESD